jgi:hypothetical protein
VAAVKEGAVLLQAGPVLFLIPGGAVVQEQQVAQHQVPRMVVSWEVAVVLDQEHLHHNSLVPVVVHVRICQQEEETEKAVLI